MFLSAKLWAVSRAIVKHVVNCHAFLTSVKHFHVRRQGLIVPVRIASRRIGNAGLSLALPPGLNPSSLAKGQNGRSGSTQVNLTSRVWPIVDKMSSFIIVFSQPRAFRVALTGYHFCRSQHWRKYEERCLFVSGKLRMRPSPSHSAGGFSVPWPHDQPASPLLRSLNRYLKMKGQQSRPVPSLL